MTTLLLAALLAAPPAAAPARAVPLHPLERLISAEDYPAAAVRAGEQGTVRVVLDVSAEGRVTGCTVTESSRSAHLDSTTCRILRARARFTPARDAAGTAVTDRVEAGLAWKMDADPQVPPAIHDAMVAWLTCLKPALNDHRIAVRALGEKAFPACRAQEDGLLTAMEDARATTVSREEERKALRAQVAARVAAARAPKKP